MYFDFSSATFNGLETFGEVSICFMGLLLNGGVLQPVGCMSKSIQQGTVTEEIAPRSNSPPGRFTPEYDAPRLLTPEEVVRGGVLDPEVAAPHWSGCPPPHTHTACIHFYGWMMGANGADGKLVVA